MDNQKQDPSLPWPGAPEGLAEALCRQTLIIYPLDQAVLLAKSVTE